MLMSGFLDSVPLSVCLLSSAFIITFSTQERLLAIYQIDLNRLDKIVLMVTTTRSAIPTNDTYQDGGAPNAII
jgi:hypothetical protein